MQNTKLNMLALVGALAVTGLLSSCEERSTTGDVADSGTPDRGEIMTGEGSGNAKLNEWSDDTFFVNSVLHNVGVFQAEMDRLSALMDVYDIEGKTETTEFEAIHQEWRKFVTYHNFNAFLIDMDKVLRDEATRSGDVYDDSILTPYTEYFAGFNHESAFSKRDAILCNLFFSAVFADRETDSSDPIRYDTPLAIYQALQSLSAEEVERFPDIINSAVGAPDVINSRIDYMSAIKAPEPSDFTLEGAVLFSMYQGGDQILPRVDSLEDQDYFMFLSGPARLVLSQIFDSVINDSGDTFDAEHRDMLYGICGYWFKTMDVFMEQTLSTLKMLVYEREQYETTLPNRDLDAILDSAVQNRMRNQGRD